MLLSQRHPLLYKASVATHCAKRRFIWLSRGNYCSVRLPVRLPNNVFSHASLLLRKLGDSDMVLQHNKVKNLEIAISNVNNIIIKPGEAFSLWKLVDKPTAAKGYLPGMLLSNGEVKVGTGGGLCQLANLLYWMVLHSPMVVTERHRHSFDPFPDQGRVLPFGSGATIFYNYLDLQFTNPTDRAFQIKLWIDDKKLHGQILSDEQIDFGYHVFEKNHHYLQDVETKKFYRTNEIWRKVYERNTGNILKEEMICSNFCEMKYQPSQDARVEKICLNNQTAQNTELKILKPTAV